MPGQAEGCSSRLERRLLFGIGEADAVESKRPRTKGKLSNLDFEKGVDWMDFMLGIMELLEEGYV